MQGSRWRWPGLKNDLRRRGVARERKISFSRVREKLDEIVYREISLLYCG